MKTPDSYPRSVAQGGLTIGGRPSPCETGELAEGVPRRLCLLKEGRGLNGKAFSEARGRRPQAGAPLARGDRARRCGSWS